MASWIKCDTCRKVLSGDQFDDGATTCRSCLTGPPPKPKKVRTTEVRTVRRADPEPAAPRGPLLGLAGSGDLEVRERRAKRSALEALAELHAEDYAQLLAAARQAEGLRS